MPQSRSTTPGAASCSPATTHLPGRIYAFDFPAYLDSLERTVEFARTRQITHVMGCHIEMTRQPGKDYPVGCPYQPDEPPLQMTVQQLIDLRDAARSIQDKPGAHTFDDFLIMNGPARRYIVKLLARAVLGENPAPASCVGTGMKTLVWASVRSDPERWGGCSSDSRLATR